MPVAGEKWAEQIKGKSAEKESDNSDHKDDWNPSYPGIVAIPGLSC